MGSLLSLVGINPESLAIKAIIVAIVLAVAFGAGVDVRGKIDAGTLAKQTLQYQTAISAANEIAAAEQQKIDTQALAASDRQSNMLEQQNATLTAELSYAKSHTLNVRMPCITYGLVRVLDAAVLGTAAGNLALPAGKSDDACSTITADDLARTVISNYATANANAEQLNALEGLLKQLQADRAAAAKAHQP